MNGLQRRSASQALMLPVTPESRLLQWSRERVREARSGFPLHGSFRLLLLELPERSSVIARRLRVTGPDAQEIDAQLPREAAQYEGRTVASVQIPDDALTVSIQSADGSSFPLPWSMFSLFGEDSAVVNVAAVSAMWDRVKTGALVGGSILILGTGAVVVGAGYVAYRIVKSLRGTRSNPSRKTRSRSRRGR